MSSLLGGTVGLGLLFFLLGIVLGSFGNVLTRRVPEGRTILGRSQCRYCRRVLRPHELIPIVSYLWLRGKCAGCTMRIGLSYPLVEIAGGILFYMSLVHHQYVILPALALGIALWLLLLIAVVDAQTSTIPDALNIPFVLVGVIHSLLIHSFSPIAILIGAGFFFLQWALSRGRWVGSGDIFLGAGAGALLGDWQLTVVFLFVSYILGALVASSLIIFDKKTLSGSLAFGPFLALGTVIALFYGDQIIQYLPY